MMLGVHTGYIMNIGAEFIFITKFLMWKNLFYYFIFINFIFHLWGRL